MAEDAHFEAVFLPSEEAAGAIIELDPICLLETSWKMLNC